MKAEQPNQNATNENKSEALTELGADAARSVNGGLSITMEHLTGAIKLDPPVFLKL